MSVLVDEDETDIYSFDNSKQEDEQMILSFCNVLLDRFL